MSNSTPTNIREREIQELIDALRKNNESTPTLEAVIADLEDELATIKK
jgi:NTP pyrophosphatase (non-canonical NTP hydrolase)